ncbi:sentrin-specific protease 7 isoform X2 [Hyperolius riggenbachi]|uniref:sentrin-specific protease 7 isoform X2 n=1 Tax=Hyperolius riggenbachi TaxID=752182 RepID=UPI0035A3B8F2
MMDRQRKDPSPPFSSLNVPTGGFKIPKKKPEDWCEEVHNSSPLSRLPDDHSNVTYRKRRCSSSYETYNTPRNKNSHAYYASPGAYRFDRTEHSIGEESECSQEKETGIHCETRSTWKNREQAQETTSNKVCRDVSNTPISPYKDFTSPIRKSVSLDQESQVLSKAREQRASFKGTEIPSTPTRDKTYCYKRTEHQNKKSPLSPSPTKMACFSSESSTDFSSDSPDRKLLATERMSGVAEEKKKTSEGSISDPPRHNPQSGIHNRKRSRALPVIIDKTKTSPEPIVLSSDEEEAGQKEVQSRCELPAKKTANRGSPSPTHEVEPMDHSGTLEDTTTVPENSESPVLQLNSLNVYFGKKKGSVTDVVKFSPNSIEIPLRVPLHKDTCLSVETKKLQKFGFWFTKGGNSFRSSAVVVLQIAPDYVPNIEKQLELSSRNQACKSNEFIFLELTDPLTSKDQSEIGDIMTEASKQGSPTLAEVLSWEEVNSLLEDMPNEECSFKRNCYSGACQPSEAKKTKATYSLLQKLGDGCYSASMVPEQETQLREARGGVTPVRLLVYPPPPTKGGLAVSSEDLECLEHGEFLNDVIIDFYLKYLMLEKFPKEFAKRCHIFSSFFFKCLTRKENSSSDVIAELPSAERRHQQVKTWTRHVDIFTKDFIFVPVNENSHWYLAVICFPWLEKAVYEDKNEMNIVLNSETSSNCSSSSVIVFNDQLSKTEENAGEDSNSGSEGSSSSGSTCKMKHPRSKENHTGKVCKRPCILIFDSLKIGSVQSTVQVIREYLKVEFQVKQKKEREFSRSSMRDYYPKVPRQNNSTDCGLYLLQYVESFSRKPIENFEPPMHLENWFNSSIIKHKRKAIRDLIFQLQFEQARIS